MNNRDEDKRTAIVYAFVAGIIAHLGSRYERKPLERQVEIAFGTHVGQLCKEFGIPEFAQERLVYAGAGYCADFVAGIEKRILDNISSEDTTPVAMQLTGKPDPSAN